MVTGKVKLLDGCMVVCVCKYAGWLEEGICGAGTCARQVTEALYRYPSLPTAALLTIYTCQYTIHQYIYVAQPLQHCLSKHHEI